ncbi:MAG TPA: hypothetical protein VGN37_25255 [Actinocatenispora sp.]
MGLGRVPQDVVNLFEGLTGMKWPQMDPDKMYELAGAYYDTGKSIQGDLPAVFNKGVSVLTEQFTMAATDPFVVSMAQFTSGSPNYLAQFAQAASEIGDFVTKTAADAEYSKLMIIAQLIELLAEIAFAIMMAEMGFFEWLFNLTIEYIITRQFIVEVLEWLFRTIVQHIIIGVATGVAMDRIIQRIQINEGHRSDFDNTLLVQAVEYGVIGGVLAGPIGALGRGLGKGIGKIVGKDVTKLLGGALGNVFTGAFGKGLSDAASKALGADLAKAFAAEIPQLLRKFTDGGARLGGNLAAVFDRHLGDIVGSDAANELGHSLAAAVAKHWGTDGLEAAVRDAVREVADHAAADAGALLRAEASRLAHDMPEAIRTVLKETPHGTLRYRAGAQIGQAAGDWLHGNMSEGFYNLIFDPSHQFHTNWITGAASAAMGRGHAFGNHMGLKLADKFFPNRLSIPQLLEKYLGAGPRPPALGGAPPATAPAPDSSGGSGAGGGPKGTGGGGARPKLSSDGPGGPAAGGKSTVDDKTTRPATTGGSAPTHATTAANSTGTDRTTTNDDGTSNGTRPTTTEHSSNNETRPTTTEHGGNETRPVATEHGGGDETRPKTVQNGDGDAQTTAAHDTGHESTVDTSPDTSTVHGTDHVEPSTVDTTPGEHQPAGGSDATPLDADGSAARATHDVPPPPSRVSADDVRTGEWQRAQQDLARGYDERFAERARVERTMTQIEPGFEREFADWQAERGGDGSFDRLASAFGLPASAVRPEHLTRIRDAAYEAVRDRVTRFDVTAEDVVSRLGDEFDRQAVKLAGQLAAEHAVARHFGSMRQRTLTDGATADATDGLSTEALDAVREKVADDVAAYVDGKLAEIVVPGGDVATQTAEALGVVRGVVSNLATKVDLESARLLASARAQDAFDALAAEHVGEPPRLAENTDPVTALLGEFRSQAVRHLKLDHMAAVDALFDRQYGHLDPFTEHTGTPGDGDGWDAGLATLSEALPARLATAAAWDEPLTDRWDDLRTVAEQWRQRAGGHGAELFERFGLDGRDLSAAATTAVRNGFFAMLGEAFRAVYPDGPGAKPDPAKAAEWDALVGKAIDRLPHLIAQEVAREVARSEAATAFDGYLAGRGMVPLGEDAVDRVRRQYAERVDEAFTTAFGGSGRGVAGFDEAVRVLTDGLGEHLVFESDAAEGLVRAGGMFDGIAAHHDVSDGTHAELAGDFRTNWFHAFHETWAPADGDAHGWLDHEQAHENAFQPGIRTESRDQTRTDEQTLAVVSTASSHPSSTVDTNDLSPTRRPVAVDAVWVHPFTGVRTRAAFDVRQTTVDGKPVTELVVTVALNPAAGVTREEIDQTWSDLNRGVRELFTDPRHQFRRPEYGTMRVTVVPVQDGGPAHLRVDLSHEHTEITATKWRPGLGPQAYGHELGHQLGLRDEHRRPGDDAGLDVDGSLMGRYDRPAPDGLSRGGVRDRHLDLIESLIDNAKAAGPPHTASPQTVSGHDEPNLPDPDRVRRHVTNLANTRDAALFRHHTGVRPPRPLTRQEAETWVDDPLSGVPGSTHPSVADKYAYLLELERAHGILPAPGANVGPVRAVRESVYESRDRRPYLEQNTPAPVPAPGNQVTFADNHRIPVTLPTVFGPDRPSFKLADSIAQAIARQHGMSAASRQQLAKELAKHPESFFGRGRDIRITVGDAQRVVRVQATNHGNWDRYSAAPTVRLETRRVVASLARRAVTVRRDHPHQVLHVDDVSFTVTDVTNGGAAHRLTVHNGLHWSLWPEATRPLGDRHGLPDDITFTDEQPVDAVEIEGATLTADTQDLLDTLFPVDDDGTRDPAAEALTAYLGDESLSANMPDLLTGWQFVPGSNPPGVRVRAVPVTATLLHTSQHPPVRHDSGPLRTTRTTALTDPTGWYGVYHGTVRIEVQRLDGQHQPHGPGGRHTYRLAGETRLRLGHDEARRLAGPPPVPPKHTGVEIPRPPQPPVRDQNDPSVRIHGGDRHMYGLGEPIDLPPAAFPNTTPKTGLPHTAQLVSTVDKLATAAGITMDPDVKRNLPATLLQNHRQLYGGFMLDVGGGEARITLDPTKPYTVVHPSGSTEEASRSDGDFPTKTESTTTVAAPPKPDGGFTATAQVAGKFVTGGNTITRSGAMSGLSGGVGGSVGLGLGMPGVPQVVKLAGSVSFTANKVGNSNTAVWDAEIGMVQVDEGGQTLVALVPNFRVQFRTDPTVRWEDVEHHAVDGPDDEKLIVWAQDHALAEPPADTAAVPAATDWPVVDKPMPPTPDPEPQPPVPPVPPKDVVTEPVHTTGVTDHPLTQTYDAAQQKYQQDRAKYEQDHADWLARQPGYHRALAQYHQDNHLYHDYRKAHADHDTDVTTLPDTLYASGLTHVPELFDAIIGTLSTNDVDVSMGGTVRTELAQKLSNVDTNITFAVNDPRGYHFTVHDGSGKAVADVQIHTERDTDVPPQPVGGTSTTTKLENVRTAISGANGSQSVANSTGLTGSGEVDLVPELVPATVGASVYTGLTWSNSDTFGSGRTGLWVLVSRYTGSTGGYQVPLKHTARISLRDRPNGARISTGPVNGTGLIRMPAKDAYKHGFPVDSDSLTAHDTYGMAPVPGVVKGSGPKDGHPLAAPLPRHVLKGRGVGQALTKVNAATYTGIHTRLAAQLRTAGFLPNDPDHPFDITTTLLDNPVKDSLLANQDLLDKLVSQPGFDSHYDQIHQDGLSFTLVRRTEYGGTRFARITVTATQHLTEYTDHEGNRHSPYFVRRDEEHTATNLGMGMDNAQPGGGGSKKFALGVKGSAGYGGKDPHGTWFKGANASVEYQRIKGANENLFLMNNMPELMEYGGPLDEFRLPSDFTATIEYSDRPAPPAITLPRQVATVHALPHFGNPAKDGDPGPSIPTDRKALTNAVVFHLDSSGLTQAFRDLVPEMAGPGKPNDDVITQFAGNIMVRSHFKEILAGNYTTDQLFTSGLWRDGSGALALKADLGNSTFAGATDNPYVLGLIKLWLAEAKQSSSRTNGVNVNPLDVSFGGADANALANLAGGVNGGLHWGAQHSSSSSRTGAKEFLELDFRKAYAFSSTVDYTAAATTEKHGKLAWASHTKNPPVRIPAPGGEQKDVIYVLSEQEALAQYGDGRVPLPDEQLHDALGRWYDDELKLPGNTAANLLSQRREQHDAGTEWRRPGGGRRLREYADEFAARYEAGRYRLTTENRDRFNAAFERELADANPYENVYVPPTLTEAGPKALGFTGIHDTTYTPDPTRGITPNTTTYDLVHGAVDTVAPGLLTKGTEVWQVRGNAIGRLQTGVTGLQALLAGERRHQPLIEDMLHTEGHSLLLVNRIGWNLADVVEVNLKFSFTGEPDVIDLVPTTGMENYGHSYAAQSKGRQRDFSVAVGTKFGAAGGGTGAPGGAAELRSGYGQHRSKTIASVNTTEQTVYDWDSHYRVGLDHNLQVTVRRLNMSGRPANNLLASWYRKLTNHSTPVVRDFTGHTTLKLPRSIGDATPFATVHQPDFTPVPTWPGDGYVTAANLDDAVPVAKKLLAATTDPNADDPNYRGSISLPVQLSRTHLTNHLHLAVGGRTYLLSDRMFVPGHSSDRTALSMTGDLYDIQVVAPLSGTGTGRYAKHQMGTTDSRSQDGWKPIVQADGDANGKIGVEDPAHADQPWATDTGDGNGNLSAGPSDSTGTGHTENYRRELHVKMQGPTYLVRMRGRFRMQSDPYHVHLFTGDETLPSQRSEPFTGDVFAELSAGELAELQRRVAERTAAAATTDEPRHWPVPGDTTPHHNLHELLDTAYQQGYDAFRAGGTVSGQVRRLTGAGPLVLTSHDGEAIIRRYEATLRWAVDERTRVDPNDPHIESLRQEIDEIPDLLHMLDGPMTPQLRDQLAHLDEHADDLTRALVDSETDPTTGEPAFTKDNPVGRFRRPPTGLDPVSVGRQVAHELDTYVDVHHTDVTGTTTRYRIGPDTRVYELGANGRPLSVDQAVTTLPAEVREGVDLAGLDHGDLADAYQNSWLHGQSFDTAVRAEIRARLGDVWDAVGSLPDALRYLVNSTMDENTVARLYQRSVETGVAFRSVVAGELNGPPAVPTVPYRPLPPVPPRARAPHADDDGTDTGLDRLTSLTDTVTHPVDSVWVDPVSRKRYRAAFDVALTAEHGRPVVEVTVRVRIDTDETVTTEQLDATWAALRQGVFEEFTRPRHALTDLGRLTVTVVPVTDGPAHLTVDLSTRNILLTQTRWRPGLSPRQYAHEFGHQLGLRDERGTTSLLGDFTGTPADGVPQGGVRDRHLRLLSTIISGSLAAPPRHASPATTAGTHEPTMPSLAAVNRRVTAMQDATHMVPLRELAGVRPPRPLRRDEAELWVATTATLPGNPNPTVAQKWAYLERLERHTGSLPTPPAPVPGAQKPVRENVYAARDRRPWISDGPPPPAPNGEVRFVGGHQLPAAMPSAPGRDRPLFKIGEHIAARIATDRALPRPAHDALLRQLREHPEALFGEGYLLRYTDPATGVQEVVVRATNRGDWDRYSGAPTITPDVRKVVGTAARRGVSFRRRTPDTVLHIDDVHITVTDRNTGAVRSSFTVHNGLHWSVSTEATVPLGSTRGLPQRIGFGDEQPIRDVEVEGVDAPVTATTHLLTTVFGDLPPTDPVRTAVQDFLSADSLTRTMPDLLDGWQDVPGTNPPGVRVRAVPESGALRYVSRQPPVIRPTTTHRLGTVGSSVFAALTRSGGTTRRDATGWYGVYDSRLRIEVQRLDGAHQPNGPGGRHTYRMPVHATMRFGHGEANRLAGPAPEPPNRTGAVVPRPVHLPLNVPTPAHQESVLIHGGDRHMRGLGQRSEADPAVRSVGVPKAGLPHLPQVVSTVEKLVRAAGATVPAADLKALPRQLLNNYRQALGGLQVSLGTAEALVTIDPTHPWTVVHPSGSFDAPTDQPGAITGDDDGGFHSNETINGNFQTGTHNQSRSGQLGALNLGAAAKFGLGLGPGVAQVLKLGVAGAGTANKVSRATTVVQDAETGMVEDTRSDSTLLAYVPNWRVKVRTDPAIAWADLPNTAVDGPENEKLLLWVPDHYLADPPAATVTAVPPTDPGAPPVRPVPPHDLSTPPPQPPPDATPAALAQHEQAVRDRRHRQASYYDALATYHQDVQRHRAHEAALARFARDRTTLPDSLYASGLTRLDRLFDAVVTELTDAGLSLPAGSTIRGELAHKVWNLDTNLKKAVNDPDGYHFTLTDGGHIVATVTIRTTRNDGAVPPRQVGGTSDTAHVENVRTAIAGMSGSQTLTRASDVSGSGEVDLVPVPLLTAGASAYVGFTWSNSDGFGAGRTGLWVLVSRYAGYTNGYHVSMNHTASIQVRTRPDAAPRVTTPVTGEGLLRLPEPDAFRHGFRIDHAAVTPHPTAGPSPVPGVVRGTGPKPTDQKAAPLPLHVLQGKGVGQGLTKVDDAVSTTLRRRLTNELRTTGFLPRNAANPFHVEKRMEILDSQFDNMRLLDKMVSGAGLDSHYDQVHQDGMAFTLVLRRHLGGMDFARITVKADQRLTGYADHEGNRHSEYFVRTTDEYHAVNLAMGMDSATPSTGGGTKFSFGVKGTVGYGGGDPRGSWFKGTSAGIEFQRSIGASEGLFLMVNRPELLEYPGTLNEYRLPSDWTVTIEYSHLDAPTPITLTEQFATVHLLPAFNNPAKGPYTQAQPTPKDVLDTAVVFHVDSSGLTDASRALLPDLHGPGATNDDLITTFASTISVRSHLKEIVSGEYTTDQLFEPGLWRDDTAALALTGTLGDSTFAGATADKYVIGLIKLWLAEARQTASKTNGVTLNLPDAGLGGKVPGRHLDLGGALNGNVHRGWQKSVSTARTGAKEFLELDFHRAYAFASHVDLTVHGAHEKHGKLAWSSVDKPAARTLTGKSMIYLLSEPDALARYARDELPLPDEQIDDVLQRWAGGDLHLSGNTVAGILTRRHGELDTTPWRRDGRIPLDVPAQLVAQRHRDGRLYVTGDAATAFAAAYPRAGLGEVGNPYADTYIPPNLTRSGPKALGHSGIHEMTFDPAPGVTAATSPFSLVHDAVENVAPGLLGRRPEVWATDGRTVVGRLQGGIDGLQAMLSGKREQPLTEDMMHTAGQSFLLVNKVGWALADMVEVNLRYTLTTGGEVTDLVPETGLENYGHAYTSGSASRKKDLTYGVMPARFSAGGEVTGSPSGAPELHLGGGQHASVTRAQTATTEQTVYDWTGHYRVRFGHNLHIEVRRLNMAGRPATNLLTDWYRRLTNHATPEVRDHAGTTTLKIPKSTGDARPLVTAHQPDYSPLPTWPGDGYVTAALLDDAIPIGRKLLAGMLGAEADDPTFRGSLSLPVELSRTHLTNHLFEAIGGQRYLLSDKLFLPGRSGDRAKLWLASHLSNIEVVAPIHTGTGTGRYSKFQDGTTFGRSTDAMRPSWQVGADANGGMQVVDPTHADKPWGTNTADGSANLNNGTSYGQGMSGTENYRREQHVKMQGPTYLVRMRGTFRLEGENYTARLVGPDVVWGTHRSDPFAGDVYAELSAGELHELQRRIADRNAVALTTDDPADWPVLDRDTPHRNLADLLTTAHAHGYDQFQAGGEVARILRADTGASVPLVLASNDGDVLVRQYAHALDWAIGEISAADRHDPRLEQLRQERAELPDLTGMLDGPHTAQLTAELAGVRTRTTEIVNAVVAGAPFAAGGPLSRLNRPPLDLHPVETARQIAHELDTYVDVHHTDTAGVTRRYRISPDARVYELGPNGRPLTAAQALANLSPDIRRQVDGAGLTDDEVTELYQNSGVRQQTYEQALRAESWRRLSAAARSAYPGLPAPLRATAQAVGLDPVRLTELYLESVETGRPFARVVADAVSRVGPALA